MSKGFKWSVTVSERFRGAIENGLMREHNLSDKDKDMFVKWYEQQQKIWHKELKKNNDFKDRFYSIKLIPTKTIVSKCNILLGMDYCIEYDVLIDC